MDNSEKNQSSHILHSRAPVQRWGISKRATHLQPLGRKSSSRSRWSPTSARSAADVAVAGLILVHGALEDQPRRYIKCFRVHTVGGIN